jgi:hypothetical protein
MSARRRVLVACLAAAIACGVAVGAEGGQAAAAPAAAPQPAAAPAPVPLTPAQLDAQRAIRLIKTGDVDLTVPESPAFVAIGLSPDTIIRPTTPREFATALLNGVDRSGHLQTGVAIDTVPYLVYAGNKVSLGTYKTSRATQILSRTQTSFGTTKGAGENDPSVKLSVGVHSTLHDSEDPRLNNDALMQCYAEIDVFHIDDLMIGLSSDERERRTQLAIDQFERTTLKPAADACREQFRRKARWNGTSWIVAAATTWVSPTGLAGDLDGGSLTLWTSASYGFDGVPGLRDNAQIIAHVRHHSNELVVDKDLPGGQENRDTTFAGARFRGGRSSFGLSFEAAYVRMSAPGRATDTAARLAFTAERRLAENLWLNVSFGGDSGADPANSGGMSVLSAFKYAFTKDPSLSALPR